jgi:hypothetical protein
VSGTDPAALLAGALRVDQLGDDWRAKVRSDVDQLVDDGVVDAAIADEFAGQLVDDIAALATPSDAGCTCPSPAGLCRDDCAHCTALPDEAPCPATTSTRRRRRDDGRGRSARRRADRPVTVSDGRGRRFSGFCARARSPAGSLAARDARAMLAHPGWRSRHDPASRSFGVVDRLAGKAPLRDVHLPWTPVLNQGKEGACVGFGVADAVNVLRASGAPVPAFIDDAGALDLYHAAQRVDDIPGESYTGTSVLAGMKAGAGAGLFGGYLWDFGTSAIAQTLLQLHTPVVVGVPWFDGMYDTGPGGVVHVAGKLVGGHCLCIVGLSMKGPNGEPGPWFVWRNSWGESYGVGGDGFVHHRDLGKLLRGQGEAAVPTVTAQKPA